MEDAFESLKAQGKNTLDGLLQWMKEDIEHLTIKVVSANIIDENITEDKIKKELAKADAKNVDLQTFKNALNNLAKESKKNVDELHGKLCCTETAMKDAYDKMQKEGRNSVDHLVKWLQDSKLIDNAKDAEQKARELFDGAKDKAHVELNQLKDAVTKLTDEQAKNAAEVAKSLAAQAPKLMGAFNAASSAFKDAMSKK